MGQEAFNPQALSGIGPDGNFQSGSISIKNRTGERRHTGIGHGPARDTLDPLATDGRGLLRSIQKRIQAPFKGQTVDNFGGNNKDGNLPTDMAMDGDELNVKRLLSPDHKSIILPKGAISPTIKLEQIPEILEIASQEGIGKHFHPPIDTTSPQQIENLWEYVKGYKDNNGDRPTTPSYAHPIKAEIDEHVRGFMMVRSGGKHLFGREMMIERMMVDDRLRGKRIGVQMMIAVLDWALINGEIYGDDHDQPAERVKVGIRRTKDVDAWHDTVGFFQQFGFKETKELEDENWSYTVNRKLWLLHKPVVLARKFGIEDSNDPNIPSLALAA